MQRAPSRPQAPSDTTAAGADRGFAFAQRVLIAVAVAVSVVLVVLFVWYASDLLMLLFAGILVSIALRRLNGVLQRATGLGHSASLAIVTLGLLAAAGLVGSVAAGRIASQATQLTDQLQVALETVRGRLDGYAWAQEAVERLPDLRELLLGSGGVLSRLTGLASTTLGALINVVVVGVVGVYLASQPGLYSSGVKRLLPFRYRPRAAEVLDVLDDTLGRWLLGRLALMVVNGGLTALALWAIGVPLALTLGVIAGVLNFIPNFGPFIAAVPAVLIAFTQGPLLAVYTAVVYLVLQLTDAYVLTPLVDRRSSELPPVMTISAQLLLGVLFGFIGLLVASPLTAAAMILVKMLYVEDVLGDPIMRNGAAGARQDAAHAAEAGIAVSADARGNRPAAPDGPEERQ